MKSSLILAMLIVSFPLSAAAGDRDQSPAATAEPLGLRGTFNWTGGYVGAQAGLLWTQADAELSSVVGPLLTLDVNNGVFPREIDIPGMGLPLGVHAGYSVQRGAWVAGIEGDFSRLGLDASELFSVIDPGPPPFTGAQVNSTYETDAVWLATLRLRAGMAFGRTHAYATGGLAAGDVKNSFTIAIPSVGYAPPTWSQRSILLGWVVGAGVEHAFTHKLSARLEYLHYDLEDRKVLATDPVNFPGQSIEYGYENSGNIVRAGASWRF